MEKALQTFSKAFLVVDNNVIEKKLLETIKQKPFASKKELSPIIEDLRIFFAD